MSSINVSVELCLEPESIEFEFCIEYKYMPFCKGSTGEHGEPLEPDEDACNEVGAVTPVYSEKADERLVALHNLIHDMLDDDWIQEQVDNAEPNEPDEPNHDDSFMDEDEVSHHES